MKCFFHRVGAWLLVAMWLLTAFSCQKEVSFQSSIVVKAWAQEKSGGEQYRLTDVVVYGFAADTTLYAVTDYEEALAGIMRRKSDPTQTIEAQLKGSVANLSGYGEVQMMPAPGYQSLLLLVVDCQNQLFGYTQLELVENLPYLYVSVQFQPWKEGTSYKNGLWWMYNSYYVADIGCTIRPSAQYVEQGEIRMLTGSRLFVYAVDEPEEWLPLNWSDAEVGRLTHQQTGDIADPDYSFAAESKGTLSAKFPPDDYLMMVVNAPEHCYALRAMSEPEIRAEYESDKEDKGFQVLFPLWNLRPPYTTEDGWSCYYTPEISLPVATTIQREAGGSVEPLTGSKLYAYCVEEMASWGPASLVDAANGLLQNSLDGATLEPDYSLLFGEESEASLLLPLDNYLLMVVNDGVGCYAMRYLTTEEVELTFAVNFPLADLEEPMIDQAGWELHYIPNLKGSIKLYAEFVEPGQQGDETTDENDVALAGEGYAPYEPNPESATESLLLKGSSLYAFAAEGLENLELWLPRNLNDVDAGRLQNSETGAFIVADYSTVAANGNLSAELPFGDWLLMLSNSSEGCYALGVVDHQNHQFDLTFIFPLWRGDFPLEDSSGWRYFYTPNVRASIPVSVEFEQGDEEPIALDCTTLYIYRLASIQGWAPMDYAAALEGRIRNAETGEERWPDQSYEANRDETTLEVNLLRDSYLLMVVTPYNSYALHSLTTADTNSELPLNFQLWRTDSPYIDQAGWSVYTNYEQSPDNE